MVTISTVTIDTGDDVPLYGNVGASDVTGAGQESEVKDAGDEPDDLPPPEVSSDVVTSDLEKVGDDDLPPPPAPEDLHLDSQGQYVCVYPAIPYQCV